MVNWNLLRSVKAVRVVAGNVDKQSNEIEIACNGSPMFDDYRSLGLFSMDKSLHWAHVYGTSMEPEGIEDGAFVAYEPSSLKYTPTPSDVVLLEIEGEIKKTNLHGGFKLRKFVSVCEDDPTCFNEISYDKRGVAHCGIAKLSLIRGRVLFQ